MEGLKRASARAIATEAIGRNILVRQPCEVCGSFPTQAHHTDYDAPLDVTWLCEKHHVLIHSKPSSLAFRPIRKTEMISIRLTPQERTAIRRMANHLQMNVTQMCRRLLIDENFRRCFGDLVGGDRATAEMREPVVSLQNIMDKQNGAK